MKILFVSDEECPALWDYYVPGRLSEYDLIVSCGDLNANYLSFLVTMARVPVMYVHGNHDGSYDKFPPEGCDCIDGCLVNYKGLRILGLGGCRQYHPGPHQYSEKQMHKRIGKLRRQLKKAGGVDIVVAHSPIAGIGDGQDPAHRGFEAFRTLLDECKPKYFVHGHVHIRYGVDKTRVRTYGETTVINACERYCLEIPDDCIPKATPSTSVWRKWKEKRNCCV